MMNQSCRIELLGGLRLIQAGQTITRFRTRKTGELLAYLAYYRQRVHPREILIELLWPETDEEAGRHSLSVALSSLRQQLEPPGIMPDGSVLIADRHAVGLSATVTTDVADFEAAIRCASSHSAGDTERAEALAKALELYQGELLPGYYEDWIFPEQQRLDELFFQTLRQLITRCERAGDFGRALQYALQAVGADRLREEAHQEVIRLYAAAGRPAAAWEQYQQLERLLKAELEALPSSETRALLRPIQPDVPPEQTPLRQEASLPLQAACASISKPASPDITEAAVICSEQLEPVGGAVPLQSKFYIVRSSDAEFHAAIARRDSIVLVKGARQVGKTSLLARGLQQARETGCQVVLTHFQLFNAAHLHSAETLLLALAEAIAEQLELDVLPAEVWDSRRGANPNFRRYLRREVLGKLSEPLVWGLDEVDRLFSCAFASEVFGLFRSWHDERALDPGGPWSRLTLAIAYSTEAHLFITDVNQSPFNVGTRLSLEDFTLEQVADLNERHGSPLKTPMEVSRFYHVVSGHPYLVRRGLHEMAAHGVILTEFEVRASSEDWIFGEHLRRIAILLTKDSELSHAVREILAGRSCPNPESFYRLRSAGVLKGPSLREVQFRCPLYASYLQRHLT